MSDAGPGASSVGLGAISGALSGGGDGHREGGRPLPLVSGIPLVEWPVLPAPHAATLLSVLFQLEHSQWWSPDAIGRAQAAQLAPLLDHAERTVPFYADTLASCGRAQGSAPTSEQWLRIPVLSRPRLQMAGASLVSAAIPAEHGDTSQMMTSGSTGRPVATVGTDVTQLFWRALTVRDHQWHGRDYSAKLAVIRQFPAASAPPPEGSGGTNWGPATRGLFNTGPCALFDINHTLAEQAEWLQREDPGYLLTYPSNARALARHFSLTGAELPGLLEVRTFGELVEPGVREECRKAWGVRLVDMYSSQEVGYIALQCPESETYHVQSENLVVEVVDDDGAPCAPGTVGRVLVTTLHNYATPLLRYDVGDYAEVGEPCPCGRGLGVLNRVLGRQRNMLTLPDGNQIWPTLGDPEDFQRELGHLPPILQFQVIQRTVDALEVKLVTAGHFGQQEENTMRSYLRKALGHSFDVTYAYVDEIPRSAGGKFEDFRCELDLDR